MRALLALTSLTLVAAPLAAQSAGFVTLLGRDTAALEQVTRSAGRVEGDLLTMFPRARRVHYLATLDARGYVSHFELRSDPAVATPPAPSTVLVVDVVDTVVTMIRTQSGAPGSRTDTLRVRVNPGAVPYVGLSTGMLEQLTVQAARAGKDSVAIETLLAGQRQATPNFVARRGADSVAIDYFGSPFYLRVDAAGRVLGLNGSRTTQKLLVTRVDRLDLAQASEPFLARERAGQRPGPMSPRDTARATVAGATVTVDYGRPSMRGRVILGGIVPWGEVWRTGANSATQLETTADLVVGQTVIPAGKYTLWTLPTPEGVKLIINKRTGQWGTEYDQSQDLVRLDLKSEQRPDVVEQFKIEVVDLGKGGELRFDWDRVRWILPFALRAP